MAIPALLAAAAMLVSAILLDRQNQVIAESRLRTDTLNQISLIRAKLEGHISSNIQLVKGLVAVISTEPEMNQARYDTLARNLVGSTSQLRSIAAAPDLVIRMTYPLKGNEAAIGLDYRTNAAQWPAVQKILETGQLSIAGPVDLVQGGRGFIGRFPVYSGADANRRFWGLVSAVVDAEQLYADSGLYDSNLALDISITGRDGTGGSGQRFFGPDLSGANPVIADVVLPSGTWQIAAAPRQGWGADPVWTWSFRGLILLAGALILLPVAVTGRMMQERHEHIHDLEDAHTRIEHNALHDSLTGLPNRRYLDETLRNFAAEATETAGPIALLHIDLDRFKQINDTLGHAAGDAMLIHCSKVLRANCHDTDFVARTGGDEFVIVSKVESSMDSLRHLADRIVQDMRRPVSHEGHEVRFGVSVGVAVSKSNDLDAKQLLINADIALYRAKALGRNRYEFFTAALQAEVLQTKQTADEILEGLDTNAFVAHYQPQFCARSLALVGVEALARWQHPRHGLRSPDSFLSVAEELNVVPQIDRLILQQALVDLAHWDARNVAVPRVSVNVSLRRLHDQDLIDSLRALPLPAGRLAFELVESIYLDESEGTVAWNIDQIKELGIDLEIDDFGTGYASIVSLQKLRPRRLKIDRQLVLPIVERPEQRKLVASIVDIGKAMNVEIVAEGVETMEHAHLLRDLGCDILQGYALGRPMSRDTLEEFLRREPIAYAS